MAATGENLRGKPRWVKDQRNSWHGVDFMYHTKIPVETYHKRYCETLLAVDESLGRIMDALQAKGWLDDTLLVYMGDNGFCFGEHGLTDKRTAYEASMRVPLMVHCPALFEGGRTIDHIVANIDIAPTFLKAAGVVPPQHMQGRSFLGLMQGADADWRDGLLYEHYWERNHPHTPTLHAYVTDRWKYIHYHGIWDTDELYDRENDPLERHNLISSPTHQDVIENLNSRMFAELQETGGMSIPVRTDTKPVNNLRARDGAPVGDFPPWLYAEQ
jgi:N-acetylglucosamine-6-sulfatase